MFHFMFELDCKQYGLNASGIDIKNNDFVFRASDSS
jgi:hypothetical protein